MTYSANRPVIVLDSDRLRQQGITKHCLRRYFPEYILQPRVMRYGSAKRLWFLVLRVLLKALVAVFLAPRRSSGSLGKDEVDEVYNNQAGTYDRKHHRTTRGMDLIWRRAAGWLIATVARATDERLNVLDLCTGTGLTVQEVLNILREWGVDADVVGLDFNEKMLAAAKARAATKLNNVRFVRGDAMDLTAGFKPDTFSLVTQVFGIGGIPEPTKVFDGVLQILKPGGRFLMTDMHKPIPQLPGEWPFLLSWCRFPTFEAFAYESVTVPVVLSRLWGWRDTTASFYLLTLATYRDATGRFWGFAIERFEQESQRWWFALPFMPVASIVVKKIEISEAVARERQAILAACAVC